MQRTRARLAQSARSLGMVLALMGQLLLALGVPLPAPSRSAGQAFPCQGRPCGCLDAAECWQGDCCCFTLEQKVAWADAHGVELPAHVRPLLAKRKAEEPPPCPECEKLRQSNAVPVRWIVGAFAGKCRGEGPAGLLLSEPAIPPVTDCVTQLAPEAGEMLAVQSNQPISHRTPPPAPPPRRS